MRQAAAQSTQTVACWKLWAFSLVSELGLAFGLAGGSAGDAYPLALCSLADDPVGRRRLILGGNDACFFLPRHFPSLCHMYGHSVLSIDLDTLMQLINSSLAVDIRDTNA